MITGGGIKPKNLTLNGYFYGSNRFVDMGKLGKHIYEPKLKKLYFSADKYAIVLGKSLQTSITGGRYNIYDYVARFQSPLGVLWGNTEKTSGTNTGIIDCYIKEITGTVTSGASAITLADNHDNGFTISSTQLDTSDEVHFYFISLVNTSGNIYSTKFNYCYNTTQATELRPVLSTNKTSTLLRLAPGENITTISNNTTNMTNDTYKWHNAFVMT
jgi:hypothetical protein